MTELKRLNVSLTKHGAHKVAQLLTMYDKDKVVDHSWGKVPGINIERAQTLKTLAADRSGRVPALWNEARARGSETVNALVLLAIIFSHHQLISAMKLSTNKGHYVGRVNRRDLPGDKAFTNFAGDIEELGFSTAHATSYIDFDLHRIFQIPGLNELARELLREKLRAARWDEKRDIIDEATSLGFHEVLSVPEAQFRRWLESGASIPVDLDEEDAAFFFDGDDTPHDGTFEFRPGHRPKKTGKVKVKGTASEKEATLLHNAMQTSLYDALVKQHGKTCVAAENPTGHGTSVDLVVKTDAFCWFYEIKTAKSVKACIRQAIPQLLEYAYWSKKKPAVDRLIIVGPKKITKEATAYLQFLNATFGLKISYEHHP
jgi:hypothetical protein